MQVRTTFSKAQTGGVAADTQLTTASRSTVVRPLSDGCEPAPVDIAPHEWALYAMWVSPALAGCGKASGHRGSGHAMRDGLLLAGMSVWPMRPDSATVVVTGGAPQPAVNLMTLSRLHLELSSRGGCKGSGPDKGVGPAAGWVQMIFRRRLILRRR
ncbi:hypothetical protein ACQP2X_39505 [Actinoplanes sp. CA-131856]